MFESVKNNVYYHVHSFISYYMYTCIDTIVNIIIIIEGVFYCLAVRTNASKSKALATLYGHLSLILVCSNAGAITMRSNLPLSAFNEIILDL